MKKSLLVQTLVVEPLSEALDNLEEAIDADPFLFCGGKTIIAREALAPLGRAIDRLVHTHPSLRSDGKTVIALEHLSARFEGLLSRAGVSMANQGG